MKKSIGIIPTKRRKKRKSSKKDPKDLKPKERLKMLYRKRLKPALVVLENDRKVLQQHFLIFGALVAVTILSFIALNGEMINLDYLFTNHKAFMLLGVVIFLALLVRTVKGMMLYKGYRDKYKTQIVENIIKVVDHNYSYNPDDFIPTNDYEESELFPQRYNIYKGDDFVEGSVGETPFYFSELNTKYETGSGKNRRVEHIFHGIFLIAKFNKKLKSKTLVLPDIAEKSFGKFIGQALQKLNKGRGDLVKLENPRFEKEFAVYSKDQIEARYVLTPKMMENILKFQKRAKRKIHLSFLNNKMFFAISYNRNLFEPKIFGSGVSFKDVMEVYDIVKLCSGIINELNLNTRIWKQ